MVLDGHGQLVLIAHIVVTYTHLVTLRIAAMQLLEFKIGITGWCFIMGMVPEAERDDVSSYHSLRSASSIHLFLLKIFEDVHTKLTQPRDWETHMRSLYFLTSLWEPTNPTLTTS